MTARPRRIGRGRRALGVLAVVVLLLALGVGLGWRFAVPPYVASKIRAVLDARGLEGATFRVAGVGLRGLVVRDVRLGPDCAIEAIRVDYAPSRVLEGRVDRVTIEGARVTLAVTGDGLQTSSLAKLFSGGGSSSGGGFPLEELRLVRSRVVLDFDVVKLPLDLDGSLLAYGRRAKAALRGRSGEVDVDLTGDVGPAGAHVAFALAGTLPRHTARRFVEAVGLTTKTDGAIVASARGAVDLPRGDVPRVAIEEVRVDAHLGDVRIAGASAVLHGVVAQLEGSGTIGPDGLALQLSNDSRVGAQSARVGDVARSGAIDVATPAAVHANLTGVRIDAARPIAVRVADLALGARSGLRFEAATLDVAPRVAAPLVAWQPGAVRFTALVDGTASGIRGVARGREARVTGEVAGELGGDEPWIEAPVRVESASLALPAGDVSLVAPAVDLPFAWGLGRTGTTGTIRARAVRWRDIRICAATGEVHLDETRVSLDARCARERLAPPVRAELRYDPERGGRLALDLARSPVRTGSPAHRVAAELLRVRISGTARAKIDLDLDTIAKSTVDVDVEGATVDDPERDLRVEGVRGSIRLARIEPLVTADDARFEWRRATVDDKRIGRGRARVALEREGVRVVDLGVAALGGEISVLPFRVDRAGTPFDLDVVVHGLAVDDVLETVSKGRASGTGRVDGVVSLRVERKPDLRVVFDGGSLSARAPGRIRVKDVSWANETLRFGRDDFPLHRRILAALSDFRYRRLALTLPRDRRNSRATLRVGGRGRVVPQTLDLTVNVRGIQKLVDAALRLYPSSGIELSAHVEQ